MSDIFHPDRRVVCDLWVFCDKFPRHEGDIPCRGHMFQRIRKSAAVNKFCVLHSESFCPLIHHLHECPLIAADKLRHGHRRVVSGGDDDALDQGLHRLDLALLQKHLGSAHRFRMSACHHLVCQVDLSRLQGVKDQDQCHDLRDTGRTSLFVCVFLIDGFSGRCLHQNRTGRLHSHCRLCLPFLCKAQKRQPGHLGKCGQHHQVKQQTGAQYQHCPFHKSCCLAHSREP